MTNDPSHDPARDDVSLMADLAAGRTGALDELVGRHQEKVLALAFRTLGDPEAAQDVAQEAFIKVLRSARRYQPTAKFTTWLYRIVVNCCLDLMRRRRPSVNIDDVASPAAQGSAAAEAIQAETAQAVRHAVEALPDRQRLVIVLHRFGGLSHREVAQATGWSNSAVESLLTRAYVTLRQRLTRGGLDG
ncbi:MAG: sigma-70 family RNA polymerase sigma factor [Planctomycetota bacterium]|nr:sigma-70 family RNA polymerase sigma factor [Planctomycetota bacterium]